MRHESPSAGRKLFTIAVVADTHMNEGEDSCMSPFEVNRLANARTRYAVEAINREKPELVIHLGDLIHPVPSLPSYAEAARRFNALMNGLEAPLHLVPGNHDVGDKPIAWGPSGIVRDEFIDLWKEHFGAHYYSVAHRGCRFLVVNAQIINSGLACEAEQRAWLEEELEARASERCFICIHYPPYLTRPDERESYDNIAEPGRRWLLSLIERHAPEALFAGHVHNFWYNRHGETDCYVLPSTAFVRQDYSEFYRIEPGPEGGRNDAAKLGFLAVDIHERGHCCHVHRTFGATQPPGTASSHTVERTTPPHVGTRRHPGLGIDLRQPWAETIEVTASGALDEFERKEVRNDYPLMALWEMGVRNLRVPLQDLVNPATRARMADMRRWGHRFTVYTYRVPESRLLDVLVAHAHLVDAWEVVTAGEAWEQTLAAIVDVKANAELETRLSKLRSKDDLSKDGRRYYHTINHGFTTGELEQLPALASAAPPGVIDGFVLRCERGQPPFAAVAAAQALAETLHLRVAVHVRQCGDNPAEVFGDEHANAMRAAEAAFAAAAAPEVDVFLDTFADVDRGYFMRAGLVDRRYNPRAGWHLLRNLHGALDALEGPVRYAPGEDAAPGVRWLDASSARVALVKPGGEAEVPGGACRQIDLLTGEISVRNGTGRARNPVLLVAGE